MSQKCAKVKLYMDIWYDLCPVCFKIAWVDWDSGPHFFKFSVWSETQADFVTALREISHFPHVFSPFHRRSVQPKVDFSQFTSLEPCRNGWQNEEFHIRVWIDDIWIPKCQHALPNALHLGVFKKVGSLASLSSQAQQNTPIGPG